MGRKNLIWCCLFLAPCFVSAQEPSLQETVEWILSEADDHVFSISMNDMIKEEMSLSWNSGSVEGLQSCTIYAEYIFKTAETYYQIDLRKLDLNSVYTRQFQEDTPKQTVIQLEFTSTNGVYWWSDHNSYENRDGNRLRLDVWEGSHTGISKKLVNAIKHAGRLCGSRAEPKADLF